MIGAPPVGASQVGAERILARRHLADFCALTDPLYERARHSDLLCAELEAIERGDNDRLMVFEPPRHSKSYHASERFPAWFMGRNPRKQLILTSYSADRAEANSRKARNLFYHPSWPFPETALAGDSKSVSRWETTKGGIVTAAGAGGSITGFGAHVMLIDDPIKDREEADSETIREKIWDWWTDAARTRLMPRGAVVLVCTRWHEDDLAGRLLAQKGALSRWRIINLPAIAEDDDQLGRKKGEALWPEWYPTDVLEEIRRDITGKQGDRSWLALFQQRPRSEAGGMFQREWWQRYSLPLLRRKGLRPKVLVVDCASKTALSNDYSVIAAWGELDGLYYLIDLWRDRVEYPELKTALRDMHTRWRCPILVEDKNAGTQLIQELRRPERSRSGEKFKALPAIPYDPGKATKESRASLVTGIVKAGLCAIPDDALWAAEFLEEHTAFPQGKHDDQVDTTSMALSYLHLQGGADDPLGKLLGSSQAAKVSSGKREVSRWI